MSIKKTRVYVLDNGELMIDKNVFLKNGNVTCTSDKELRFMKIPIYTVFIDHPEGKILFDTSCYPQKALELLQEGLPYSTCNKEKSNYIIKRLEYLGVSPKDIRYVVISHLHFDHAGCLEMFPNSWIIVHEDELFYTLKHFHLKTLPLGYVEKDISKWLRMNLYWKTVKRHEKKIMLVEGIEILNFGSGHTWGMLGMRINLQNTGNIILASDAVYSREHYILPIQLPSEDAIYDLEGYLETIKEIRNYAREGQVQIWFGHDNIQFQSLIKSTEGYYE
ncbi:TPA: N-acyl homoserine lactonase family protein [Bacillus cereus]|nr:N-acyl homoserine lactonase family protein [Bacillus cereus]